LSHFIDMVKTYETKIPHEIIFERAGNTPLLFSPANQNCPFVAIYGLQQVTKQLSTAPKLLNDTALCYNGEKLKVALANIENPNIEVVAKTVPVYFVRGTACDGGGYVVAHRGTPTTFTGRAWVYDTLEAADKALLSGSIPDESILVVQNAVGMSVSCLAHAIEGMQRQSKIAIVTDGVCDKTSALVVTRCTPDTYANEDFANIQNGDTLTLELSRGRFATSTNAKDMKTRGKRNAPRKPQSYFV